MTKVARAVLVAAIKKRPTLMSREMAMRLGSGAPHPCARGATGSRVPYLTLAYRRRPRPPSPQDMPCHAMLYNTALCLALT